MAHAENTNDIELLERWEYGDSVEPVRYYLHREVNRQLKNHASPAVLPYRKSEIYFFPDCLRGALYTLFMLELSGRQRPAMLCARPGCGRCGSGTSSRYPHSDRSPDHPKTILKVTASITAPHNVNDTQPQLRNPTYRDRCPADEGGLLVSDAEQRRTKPHGQVHQTGHAARLPQVLRATLSSGRASRKVFQ